ncbi:hypothetical protein RI367_001575 [Sorochytrium milnesiophthora]
MSDDSTPTTATLSALISQSLLHSTPADSDVVAAPISIAPSDIPDSDSLNAPATVSHAVSARAVSSVVTVTITTPTPATASGTPAHVKSAPPEVLALEPDAYLEAAIFPVLLPGLEKLLKGVKKQDNDDAEEVLVNGVHPIAWLAQYLFRRKSRTVTVATPIMGQPGSTGNGSLYDAFISRPPTKPDTMAI